MKDAATIWGDNYGQPVPILAPTIVRPLVGIRNDPGGSVVATCVTFEVRTDEGASIGHLYVTRPPDEVDITISEAEARCAPLVIWAVRMKESHPSGRAWLAGDIHVLIPSEPEGAV